MPTKKKAEAEATTLYRLRATPVLAEAIKEKYRQLPGLTQQNCRVGDRPALLVAGTIGSQGPVKWSGRVNQLTGLNVALSNVTAAGVLLVRTADDDAAPTWALCWGMGWLLLDQARVDAAFGQRLALRAADPQGLNSLTRKVMDERAKVDRSSIPSGEGLPGYGIGGFGELVTRVVASAKIPGLTSDGKFRIRGADAVSVPLGISVASLLADLDVIEQLLKQPPKDELKVLEQLVPVKKDSEEHRKLEVLLGAALKKPAADSKVSLAWPHEHLNDNGTPESFKVKGKRERGVRPDLPTAALIHDLVGEDPLRDLDRIKVQLFGDSDGESAVSTEIPLRKWVAFEVELDGRRYFLHDGEWFAMDTDYAKHLDKRVADIFEKDPGVSLPPWKSSLDEAAYNEEAAKQLGAVCLDRKLVQTAQNRRGFEASDLILNDGAYVHVKGAKSSAPLSHLFAQGSNAAHALQYDEEARHELKHQVARNGGDADIVGTKPAKVVFGIARKGSNAPFNGATLYSFSKVTLVRVYDELEGRGIRVRLCPIEYVQ